jgi:uncharacterized protein (TIGR03067 family)
MQRRRLVWVLVVPSMLVCGIAAGDDDSKKAKAVEGELKRLDGEWRIIAAELGGERLKSNDLVVFSGQKCTITNTETKIVFDNTITIDPTKSPKQIEVTNTKTKATWVGIYELDGDKLKAVFQGDKDAKRPTEFKTNPGSQEIMYTYERVKSK